MVQKSTIQLLRFHFSLFLLPVFLFALSQLPRINWWNAAFAFCILHLLVYPSSNGYNSYMDRDASPIGGLRNPMQPTKQLFYLTVAMDVIAVGLSLMISYIFSVGILFYILASRTYSWRGTRLKKYPVIGFLTVFIFQGAAIFFITYHACHPQQTLEVPVLPCIVASLLIGALYPLTQIYQHKEDRADGVTTLSFLLGKRGTFVFSICLFLIATACLYFIFNSSNQFQLFKLFLLFNMPLVAFFGYWMIKVWRNEAAADFKHSFRMNLISTICITLFFATVILIKH